MSPINLIVLIILTYVTTFALGGSTDQERFSPSTGVNGGGGAAADGDESVLSPGDQNDKRSNSRKSKRDRRRCNRREKSELISKLINLMSEDYERTMDMRQSDVKTLLSHKFSVLDINVDKYVDRSEFKIFRFLMGSRTGNDNCTASLFRSIDTNYDKRISMDEWIKFYTDRRVKSKAKPNSSDLASSMAAVHGLSLLNKKSDKDIKADKEKEMNEDELYPSNFSGLNVEALSFQPNSSESRQMMIDRLKKIVDEIEKLRQST